MLIWMLTIWEINYLKLRFNINYFNINIENDNFQVNKFFPVVTIENDFIGKLAYQENIILSSFPYPFQNSPLITRLVINSAHNTTDLDLLSNFFKSHLSINK